MKTQSRFFHITVIVFTYTFILLTSYISFSQTIQSSFNQDDRERIIRIEEQLKAQQKIMDTRFESVDKRFEAVDKRFESIDKRFESIDKRFEEAHTYTGWLIALFGSMFIGTISFALWDRRTMIRPFETKMKEIEFVMEEIKKEKTANKLLTALRELSKKDTQLAEVLKTYNLL